MAVLSAGAAFKQLNYELISKGRPGFPRPVNNNPPPRLSETAQAINDNLLNSGAVLLSTLSGLVGTTSQTAAAQTSILALRARTNNPFAEKEQLGSIEAERRKLLDELAEGTPGKKAASGIGTLFDGQT